MIMAGVKQGCPLSPFLFAIISDVLLRHLRFVTPDILVPAYADVIAMVLKKGVQDCVNLEPTFADYEPIFRSKLHYGKSAIVPLYLEDYDGMLARLYNAARFWVGFTFAGHAKYKGFMLGPTIVISSWDAVLPKMLDCAKV